MRFPRIENAIEVCAEHLKACGGSMSGIDEVKSYLAGYLLTIIYAEFEQVINRIVSKRISRNGGDILLQSVAKESFRRKGVGKIHIGDLGETLAKFGKTCKTAFMDEVTNQAPHSAWDRITSNRHGVAHQGGSNLTYEELLVCYRESVVVLHAFARALELSTAETEGCI